MPASAKDHTAGVELTFRLDVVARLFAEDIDGSPRGVGEKTSNPILKGMHNSCNACILQCLSELADLRHPRPLAGLPSSLLFIAILEKGISVFNEHEVVALA